MNRSPAGKARYFRQRLRFAIAELKPTALVAAPGVLLRDLFSPKGAPTDLAKCLHAMMAWVARAQDADPGDGIPIYYALYGGYGKPYPEATGYLIPTLLRYASRAEKPEFRSRAVKAGDWLLTLQADDGAMPGGVGGHGAPPLVFNTGQILFGLNALQQETGEARFAHAAAKAVHWLCQVQDPDGAWRQFAYQEVPHAYYTMVSWALAEHHRITGSDDAKKAAVTNLQHVVAGMQPNGFPGDLNLVYWPNFLHFIAYTLQGLVMSADLLKAPQFFDAALPAAERLRAFFMNENKLPGAFTDQWRPDAGYTCLTGNAQISQVWTRIFRQTGDHKWLKAAQAVNQQIADTVRLTGPGGIRGAVKGSQPIWGRYLALRYPCWAVKFTADALMDAQER